MTFMLIAIGIFYLLAFLMLIVIVKLGKDADGKEDNEDYWRALRERK